MGPTASGKTELAERIADATGAQLISADAFQAYRRFDIGTAKPVDRSRYELIDILEPDDGFGVGDWVTRALAILHRLHSKGRSAIVVGGTGLYIRALFEQYAEMAPPPDPALRAELNRRREAEGLQALAAELQLQAPEIAAKTDLKNPLRVIRALERLASPREAVPIALPYRARAKIAIQTDPAQLATSIRHRLLAMMQSGFVDEVAGILASGVRVEAPAMRAIGYRTIADQLAGNLSGTEAFDRIEVETRQYAKRQRTWLRSEPRVHWLGGANPAALAESALLYLNLTKDTK